MPLRGSLYRRLKPQHQKKVKNIYTTITNFKQIKLSSLSVFLISIFLLGGLSSLLRKNYVVFVFSLLIIYFLLLNGSKVSRFLLLAISVSLVLGYFEGILVYSIIFLTWILFIKSEEKSADIEDREEIYFNEDRIRKIHKSESPVKKRAFSETSDDDNNKEIDGFFKQMESKDYNQISTDPAIDVYTDTRNFDLFRSFIFNTKISLDIMTNVIYGKLLIELLWPLKDKGVKIRIITRNLKERAYWKRFLELNKNIEFFQMNNIHAKMIIRDGERMLLGSSNMSNSSLSRTEGFYDANLITEDKDSINLANSIFESFFLSEDVAKKYDTKYNPFLYSRDSENHLPKILAKFIKEESSEIVFIMGSGLIDKTILDRIISFNKKIRRRIVTGGKWLVDNISDDKLSTMKYLKTLSETKTNEFLVTPKDVDVHAKVYAFKGQGIVIISSQNLTIDSWQSLFENGFILHDKNLVKRIIDDVSELPERKFDDLTNFREVEKPDSSWTGTSQERAKRIPWNLAISDNEWKIEKPISSKYYTLAPKREKGREFLLEEQRRDYKKPDLDFLWEEWKLKRKRQESRSSMPLLTKGGYRTRKLSYFSKIKIEIDIAELKELLKLYNLYEPKSKRISEIKKAIEWYNGQLETNEDN